MEILISLLLVGLGEPNIYQN